MTIRYNEFVKEPYQEEEYEPRQIEELMKCEEDIFYFMNFVTIVSNRGIREKLGDIFYEFQKSMLSQIINNKYSIFLFPRQSSKTTTCGVYALHKAIFTKDVFIGIASNKEKGAKDVLKRIKIMYEELPYWMKPGVVEYNKNSIEFENGSRIEASSTTEDTFRGNSPDCLSGNNIITIRNKNTGLIENISLTELKNRLS